MFSIIIPTLNNLKYLKFCLNSLKKNSKLNNEIVVHVNEDKNNKTRDYLRSEKLNLLLPKTMLVFALRLTLWLKNLK